MTQTENATVSHMTWPTARTRLPCNPKNHGAYFSENLKTLEVLSEGYGITPTGVPFQKLFTKFFKNFIVFSIASAERFGALTWTNYTT